MKSKLKRQIMKKTIIKNYENMKKTNYPIRDVHQSTLMCSFISLILTRGCKNSN